MLIWVLGFYLSNILTFNSKGAVIIQHIFTGKIQSFQWESMLSEISCEGERFPNADFTTGSSFSLTHRVDHQKAAWFESDFCVNCASCIATLLTIFNLFEISLMWPLIKSSICV